MPPSRGGRSPARAVTAHGRCGIRAVTAHVRCGIGSWGALGGRCLRMADYVRRLAATRAPPPQRANVGYAPEWVLAGRMRREDAEDHKGCFPGLSMTTRNS